MDNAQPLFDEATATTLATIRDGLFRDYLVTMLSPSPFFPKWPLSRREAEDAADVVIARMKSEPDGGAKVMNEWYEAVGDAD